MRTLLPSRSSANAIASWDPIESPSGLACEVSRKRWRRRISSQIRRTAEAAAAASTGSLIIIARIVSVVADARPGRPFRLEFLKNSFDAIALFDRLVVEERQFRDTLEAQPLADPAPQKWRRPIERARRLSSRLVVADRRVVDARLLKIGRG